MNDTTNTPAYVPLGRSGLYVYRAGLGTMQFGWSVDEDGAFDVMDAYTWSVAATSSTRLTATVPGPLRWAHRPTRVASPKRLSVDWLKVRGNRDDIVLATKVRAAMGENFADHRGTAKQREGLSRRWIVRACEDSLRRLQTDYIDLYQAHWIDPLVPIEETLGVFDDLVRAGKVRYIGCSNYSAWRLMQALWVSDRQGLERFVSIQPEYHLLAPTRGDVEAEIAQVCEYYGVGVIPYSPLAGGVLSGKYRRGEPLPDSLRATENEQNRLDERNWDIIEAVIDVAEQSERTPAQVAIGWQLSRPFVSAPILGANRPAQLLDVLDGIEVPLPAEAVARLDEVSDFHRSRPTREV